MAASRIMETMFPGVMTYAEAQKIEVHEPDVPLVVVMYRDEAEYRRRTKAPATPRSQCSKMGWSSNTL